MATELDLCEKWFRLADTNNDGAIEGPEAVDFFVRAGLPKATLQLIWELTAGNSPSMTKPQFFAALRLTSLAQSKGGTFQTAEGKAVIIGTAPPLPLPKLDGLEWVPPAPPSSPPMLARQFSSPGPLGAPYPPMSASDKMQAEALFAALDRDRDGVVQGSECAGEFVATGVDRETLREIWNAVAGNRPCLTSAEFLKCMYMIDLSRKGIPPPRLLPPEPFPVVAAGPGPVAQPSIGIGGIPPHGGQDMSLPSSLPPRVSFGQGEAQAYVSRLPPVDESKLASLGQEEQARVLGEIKSGVEKDSQLFRAEQEAELGRAKREFYEKAMQEVKMFKSRTEVRLMEAEEKARHALREAEEMERKYEESRKEAEEEINKGGSLIKSIHEATERKREKEGLLQQLKEEVLAMEQTTPEDLRKVEEDVQAVQATLATMEAKKSSLTTQLDSYRRQHDVLLGRQGDMEMAIAAAEAEVHSAKADVEKLKSKVEAAKASDDVEQIQHLLLASARVYTTVHAHACKAGIEIPAEARLSLYGRDLIWSEQLVTSAGAWDDWQEDGFVVVDAFPDTKDDMHQAIIDAVMTASLKEASGGGGSIELDKAPDARLSGTAGKSTGSKVSSPLALDMPPAFAGLGFAEATTLPEVQSPVLASRAVDVRSPVTVVQASLPPDPFGAPEPFAGQEGEPQLQPATQPPSQSGTPVKEPEQAPAWTAF